MYRNDDVEQSNHNTTHKITVTNVLVVDQYLQQQGRRATNVRSLQKEETMNNNSTTSSTTTTTLTVQMIVQAIIDPGGDVLNFSLADILDSTFERNKQTYENELAEALGTDLFVSAVEQGTNNNNSQKRVVPIGVIVSVTMIGLIILAIGLLLARRYSINMSSSRQRDQQQQQQQEDLHVLSWSSAASDIFIISPNNGKDDQKNDNGNDSLITQRPATSPDIVDPSPPSIPASPVSLGDGRPRYSVAFAPSGLSLLDADTDTDEDGNNNPYTQQVRNRCLQ